MRNYDRELSDAKAAATKAIANLARNAPDGQVLCDPEASHWVAAAVDDLNGAWDRPTDALVRQRDVRGEQVSELLDELAEARRRS